MSIDQKELRDILMEVFPDSEIPHEIINLGINDLDEWDSMGNFNLLLAVEGYYGIQFDIDEISEIKSIESLIIALETK